MTNFENIRLVLAESRGQSDYLFFEFSQLTGVGMGLRDRTCDLIVLLSEQTSPVLESNLREKLSELKLPLKSDTVDFHGMRRLVYEIPRWEWKSCGLLLYLIGSCFELSGSKSVKFYLERIRSGVTG